MIISRRVNRDYDIPPPPQVQYFSARDKLTDVRDALLGLAHIPRLYF